MQYEHRILYDWPGGELRKARSFSPFKASWQTTLDDLERELRHLAAREVVVETAHTSADLRLDGFLRSNAGAPAHPGVVLSFGSRFGDLRYWTDRYSTWQANVRAIALGLEALRAVDRYGITSRGEQYTGWARLPPGQSNGAAAPRTMTPTAARAAIAELVGLGRDALAGADDEMLALMYRQAARRVHPDASGGDRTQWDVLAEAATVLGVTR